MLSDALMEKVRELAKVHNSTQALVLESLAKFALENADVDSLEYGAAKPRGRKPGQVSSKEVPETDPA